MRRAVAGLVIGFVAIVVAAYVVLRVSSCAQLSAQYEAALAAPYPSARLTNALTQADLDSHRQRGETARAAWARSCQIGVP
jgi:hypothetical protein